MNSQFRALLMTLLLILAFIGMVWALAGCTINIEKVQVGPERFGPDEPQTIVEIQPDAQETER